MIEYRVVPAPRRSNRTKGIKDAETRYANTLQDILNEQGRDGWTYVRADLLPSEERTGLFRRSTVYHTVLVFSRPRKEALTTPEVNTKPDLPPEPETGAKPRRALPAEPSLLTRGRDKNGQQAEPATEE